MIEIIEKLAQVLWLIPLLVGITAFLESLALVGVIVPGVVILTALATVSGQQDFSLISILLSGFVGAWLGDSLSFFLGYKYKDKITNWKIFKNSQNLFQKGEVFFKNYGIASIVIGRFVGPIRPFIPIIAGIMSMNPVKFLTINSISAIFWSPAYLLPGYFLGKGLNSFWLPPNSVYVSSFVLGIFVLSAFCIGFIRKHLSASGFFYTFLENKFVNTRFWQYGLNSTSKEFPLAQYGLLFTSVLGFLFAYLALDLDVFQIAQKFQIFLNSKQLWLDYFVVLTGFINQVLPYFVFISIWVLYLILQKQYKLSIVFLLANFLAGIFFHIFLELTKGDFIEFGLALYIFLFGTIASFNAAFIESHKRHIYYMSTLVFLFIISLGVIFSASFSFLEVCMTWFLSLFAIGIFNLVLSYKSFLQNKKTYKPASLGFLLANLIWLLFILIKLSFS